MIRRGAIAVAAALLLAACQGPASDAARSDIGGAFELVDTAGRTVTDRDLLERPSVVFFGFTYCPDVCPTTLGALTTAMQALGPAADDLNVVFISVDPERDTPEQLGLYLSHFDPRIRGLTGSPEAVARAASAYRAYYRKTPLEDGGYTVDHTSMLYLFDRDGAFVEPVGFGEAPDALAARLRHLLDRAPTA